MSTRITDEILVHSMYIFLLLGSLAGLFAGLLLLLKPEWLLLLSRLANRWISTRKWLRIFSHTFAMDVWFYRYNKFFGTLLLAGSVFIVYFITDVFDKAYALKHVFNSISVPQELLDGLLDGMVLIIITGSVFVALISLFLIFRPSMMRDFESRANKPTSLRKTLKPLEVNRAGLDKYVSKHQRLVGGVILAGSIYTLVALASSWKLIS